MEAVIRYRGRDIRAQDVEFIRKLIVTHPDASRRALSKKLCEAWNWKQPNGTLRDMICRSMMLELHRKGHITLPPVRRVMHNPLAKRKRPQVIELEQVPLTGKLRDILPLEICQVRRTAKEALVNSLIETYHYLNYVQPVGEHLKYLVSAKGQPVACFCWSSAPRHLGPRDRYIGWDQATRRANIRFVAYQSRFLILPWVKVPYLASHLLGWMSRHLSSEWEKVYAHPIYFVETFVDPNRYRGTCYRAANWVYLGQTTGRGKDDQTGRANRPLKDIWGYVNAFCKPCHIFTTKYCLRKFYYSICRSR